MSDESNMTTDPMDKRADTPPANERGRMRPLTGWIIAGAIVLGTLMLLGYGPFGMRNSTATLAIVIVAAVVVIAIVLFLSYKPTRPD